MNVHRTNHLKTTPSQVPSCSPANTMTDHHRPQTSCEGVIILSSSGEVLYMSPGTAQLIRQLDSCQAGNPPVCTLPEPLLTIGREVCRGLQNSLMHGKGLACEVKQVLSSSEGPLFVYGLGMSNQPDGQFLTALIVSNAPIDFSLSREA